MNYEIHIGECINFETKEKRPELIISISEEQKNIIEMLADIEKDKDMNLWFVINKLRFKIVPTFKSTPKDRIVTPFSKLSTKL